MTIIILYCRHKAFELVSIYRFLNHLFAAVLVTLSGVLVTVTVISGVVIIVLIVVICILWRRLTVINSKTESQPQGK